MIFQITEARARCWALMGAFAVFWKYKKNDFATVYLDNHKMGNKQGDNNERLINNNNIA